MLSRYDATQGARVDCEFARKYDTVQAARVDCEFVRAYDKTAAAWVEKMKKFMELTVTEGFYDNAGNVIFNYGETYACEVEPSSRNYEIVAAIEEEFSNPVIACEYYFGNSDLCPNIASDFRSHGCIEWEVRGYLNGSLVKEETIAQGNNYAYTTIFNEPKSLTLSGTFDKIEFVCVVNSFSNYADFGKASTGLDNITIDGKLYEGNTVIDSN